MSQFENYCFRKGVKATFVDGKLIEPLPKVKVSNRIRNESYFIQKAIDKYSYQSVIEAMNNDKIILVL